jgi:hypothetical protein
VGGTQTKRTCAKKAQKIGLLGNCGNWTHVEEEKLEEAIKFYGHDWEKINQHLGTNRTLMGL